MSKTTLYVDTESVKRLQALAERLGLIASRGANAGKGSASKLVSLISQIPDEQVHYLIKALTPANPGRAGEEEVEG